jgi:7-cyano-7-deazaguanine synthase
MKPDNSKILGDLENIILANRGSVFTKPTENEGAVVIVSGGLDSTIGLYRLLKNLTCSIYPLYIKRGARAEEREIKSVQYYIALFRDKFPNLKELEVVETEVPPAKFKVHATATQLVKVGHTLRNSTLQSLGVQYAASLCARHNAQVKTVFTFSSPDDNFPHSQIEALRAQNIMTCIHTGDWSWQITSPLLDKGLWGEITKAEAILYAQEEGLDISHTYTCISNSDVACGTCDACEARLRAFKTAGLSDPIRYK